MLNITNPYAGLLSSEEEKKLGQQAQTMGLLNLASALFSAGAPSPVRQGLGTAFAQGLPAYMQGVQGTYEQGVNTMLTREKIQEMQRKRNEEEAIRKFIPQIYQAPTPETREAVATEQGPDYVMRPATAGGINYDALRQLMLASPERGIKIAEGLKSLQPKTSVQSIFNNDGQEVKVRYNEDTGQYSQLGGAKAEPLVQIDLNNMVELRTPKGALVGRIAKGAAPKGPSFSFNESTGLVIDQNTGTVSQPRDPQGNLVDVSQFRKPSESQEKQVIGVQNTRNAIDEFRNELSNFTRLDTLKPTERARIETKYRNMLMQAKEAYNLGVLNGPDLAILEQIIYNPTSMKGVVVGKEAIDAQASELDRIMGNIKSTVQARGGAVPQTTSVISKTAPPGVRQELWDIMSPESKKLWSTQR
jgi:hypothetical protein